MAGKKEIKLVPTEEQPYEIPENWCWTTIESINLYKSGSIDPSKEPQKVFELYSVPSSANNYPEIVCGEEIGSSKQAVKKDDVLLCKINPRINRVWKVSQHTENTLLASSEWIIIRTENINADYLMWCLQSKYFREYMLSNVSGVGGSLMRAQPKFVQKYPIPIAPLAEQKRIVDTIVDLFADLDRAAENAQKIVGGYEIRRNAILYQAFNGELTEDWRRENSVSDQWDDCVLLDVLKDKPRNGYSPQPVSYPTKYKSMTLSATTSGTFAPEHFKYIDEEIPESSHLWMVPGDILIQRANSLEKVGTSAIYTGGYHEFIYPDLMMKLQVKDGVSAEFIAYQLKTQTVLTYFRSNATGTAGNMPKINQQVVSSAPMRIPSLAEQQEIVRILDELLGNEQRIKEAAEEMLDKIAMMKKSILADAFRGKLGTNDPADEPATELLRQILIGKKKK